MKTTSRTGLSAICRAIPDKRPQAAPTGELTGIVNVYMRNGFGISVYRENIPAACALDVLAETESWHRRAGWKVTREGNRVIIASRNPLQAGCEFFVRS